MLVVAERCVLVHQSKAEVTGPGQVAFFDRSVGSEEIEKYTSVMEGDIFDLALRTAIAQKP